MKEADIEKARQMASRLDCLIEEDVQILAKATASTVEAWRKRGTGPEYIQFGNRPLYPQKKLLEFLESKRRARTGPIATGAL